MPAARRMHTSFWEHLSLSALCARSTGHGGQEREHSFSRLINPAWTSSMLEHEHRLFPPSGAESRKADTHKIANTINEFKYEAGNNTQRRETHSRGWVGTQSSLRAAGKACDTNTSGELERWLQCNQAGAGGRGREDVSVEGRRNRSQRQRRRLA